MTCGAVPWRCCADRAGTYYSPCSPPWATCARAAGDRGGRAAVPGARRGRPGRGRPRRHR
ncbi:hypothetical protein LT493_23165 [Streptomyces tricolor]|nr:hypothetical protein [Streptomyces tricolor]